VRRGRPQGEADQATRGEPIVHEKIHEETGRAWDIVAQAKYDAELEEHLQLLRSAGHSLFWDQFPQWPEQLQARLPHSYLIMAVREAGKGG
jgi:hypothetical protein